MSTHIFNKQLVSGLIASFLFLPSLALAQAAAPANAQTQATESVGRGSVGVASVQSGLNATARAGTLGDFCGGDSISVCIIQVVGGAVRTVLGLTGIILLGYLMYAGFLWMTSGGESEKAQEAMTMIRNAVIGMIILTTSFAISSFVLDSLAAISANRAPRPITNQTPAAPTTPPPNQAQNPTPR